MITAARQRRSAFALIIATASLSSIASAEPVTVKLGDAAVDGSFIVNYSNKWRLVGKAADGSSIEMGVWSDDASVGDLNGRRVIRRRQTWRHEKGTEAYVNIVDQKTLAPIMSQYVNAGGLYYRFEFSPDGRSVRYQRTPQPDGTSEFRISAPMEQGEIHTAAPYFDFNSGMFGLLIAGFPLREGYAARFPVFKTFAPDATPAWIDFEVKGKEMVAAGARGQVEAWLIVAHSPATEETMTFDLIKQAPYVIGLRQAWQGRDWTFEMM